MNKDMTRQGSRGRGRWPMSGTVGADGMVERTTVEVAVRTGAATSGVDTASAPGGYHEGLVRRVPDDTTKARELLGWTPTTSPRDGLARTISWARENLWWLEIPDSGAAAA